MSDSKDLTAAEILALERGDELEPVATCKDYLQVQDELKPCPFCGAGVTLENNQSFKNPDSDTLYWIECSKCMASDFESHTSANRCISAWNSRPLEDALQARIAEMEKAIDGLTLFISGLDEYDIYDQNNLQRELDYYFAINRPAPPEEVSND